MPRGKGKQGREGRRLKAESLRVLRESRSLGEQLDLLDARLGPNRGASRERQRLLYESAARNNDRAQQEAKDFSMIGRKRRK